MKLISFLFFSHPIHIPIHIQRFMNIFFCCSFVVLHSSSLRFGKNQNQIQQHFVSLLFSLSPLFERFSLRILLFFNFYSLSSLFFCFLFSSFFFFFFFFNLYLYHFFSFSFFLFFYFYFYIFIFFLFDSPSCSSSSRFPSSSSFF